MQQQQVDKAIACLHLAVKLKPDFNQAHLILGKLFESQGKQEAAKACYEKIKKEEKEKNDRGLE